MSLQSDENPSREPWGDYRLLVISELRRLSTEVKEMHEEVVKLKMKAAVLGAMCGGAIYAIGLVVDIARHR